MTRPRTLTLAGIGSVALALILLAVTGLDGALAYYVTPTELDRQPAGREARLYGIVVAGSVRWDRQSGVLRFRVTDGTTEAAVTSRSIPGAMFREGVAVVLMGIAGEDRTFEARELAVKHSEVYEPLKPGETLPPTLLETLRSQGERP